MPITINPNHSSSSADKFPEAIVSKCKKCTEKQKESFEKIVLYYTEKEPEKWKAILARSIEQSQKKKKSV